MDKWFHAQLIQKIVNGIYWSNGVCKWAARSVRQTNLAWEIPNIAAKKFEIIALDTTKNMIYD